MSRHLRAAGSVILLGLLTICHPEDPVDGGEKSWSLDEYDGIKTCGLFYI